MKNSLRQGGANAINVYTVGFQSGIKPATLLGYATFPSDFRRNGKLDGIVLKYNTLPGGTMPRYDMGRILTHEVEHWVGLYHTFQGGCRYGDQVADTPPEARPVYGCPTSVPDSCRGGGVDPIHNYMDYTVDACKEQFTPGQIQRLQRQMAMYRGVSFN